MNSKTRIRKHKKVLQKEKDMEVDNNDNAGKHFYQDEKNINENEATQVDAQTLGEDERIIISDILLDLMNDKGIIKPKGFNKIDRCVLPEWSRKINSILEHIRTQNITDTKILIKAAIVYVGKKIGFTACGNKNKMESEPWWKRIEK